MNQKIELKQREHLVSLIERAKNVEKNQLEEKNDVTESSVIVSLLKKGKGAELLKSIRAAEHQMHTLESIVRDNRDALEEMGFDIGRSTVSLRWSASQALRSEVAKILDEARRPIEKSLKKYDLALSRIWIAMTGDELLKAVEGLI